MVLLRSGIPGYRRFVADKVARMFIRDGLIRTEEDFYPSGMTSHEKVRLLKTILSSLNRYRRLPPDIPRYLCSRDSLR